MDKEFLHKINIDRLKKETGLTLDDLAKLAGYSRPSNLNKWDAEKERGGARPSYNTFVKLIQAGATIETLFGVEYKAGIKIVEKPLNISDVDLGYFFQLAADKLKNNP